MALVPLIPTILDASVSSDISLGMRGAKRKVHRYHIAEQLARQIFKMYYEREPLIDVCKTHRYALTFQGQMDVTWGGGDIEPLVLSSDNERDELEALFRRALDYRDMFGMVPMKLRRKGKATSGKPLMYISPFGSGRFVMEYDPIKLETEVIYEVMAPQHPHRTGERSQKSRAVTRVLDVFVWPGQMPSLTSKKFRSKISGLMAHYVENRELRKNLVDADWRAAHPVVFTQARPDTRNIQEMTEDEVFGAPDDSSIMSTTERHAYSRDVHRAIRTEETVAAMNSTSMTGTAAQAGARQSVDPNTMLMMEGQRAITWDGALYNLPHGEEMTRGITPQSRSDLATLQLNYEEMVCLAMGMPRSFITGGVTARVKGDTEHMRQIVRTAVLKDRADINLFYTFAYELVNRKADDDMMVNALIATDSREQQLSAEESPDERKRIADIRANITKISAMPYRTRVVFQEDPLPKKVEIPVIAAAVTAGALSKLELVNIFRAEIGLGTIDQEHELIRGDNAETTVATVDINPTTGSVQKAAAPAAKTTPKASAAKKKATKAESKAKAPAAKKKVTKTKEAEATPKGGKKREAKAGKEKKEPAKKKRRKGE